MEQAKKRISPRTRSRVLFYSIAISLPLLQTLICYVYVNANMFIMAFQEYSYLKDSSGTVLGYDIAFTFQNFAKGWTMFTDNYVMVERSLILFAVNMFIGFPLALIFSFYIAKQFPMSKLFRIMLFMPQIISSLVFTLLFRYVVNAVYPVVAEIFTGVKPEGLMSESSPQTVVNTIIFYNVWVSFGVKTLLFSGTMSAIDESIIESAKLDGANYIKEFFYITLPLSYGTIIQFIIGQVVAIFTDGMYILGFYGNSGKPYASIGYYMYVQTLTSDYIAPEVNKFTFGELSAFGLILTAMILPVTLIIRKLLYKFGPSVD